MNKLGRELLYACTFLATCMWCARGQLIKGCPMYGCKSSGSFSFVLPNVPMNNVGVVWTRKHVSTMLPDGVSDLGCVGNEFNVICNAHTGTSNGYIAVDPVDGSISWTDKQLHDPALPLMTQFGDIIATDGKALVYYYSNGSSNGDPITFMYDFTPVYSLTLSSNYRFFIHSASEGIFLTYGLDGIVDASMYLNETINGMKGAFVPIAQPVIYGSRIYSLMRFKSEDGFLVADIARLYAVDITGLMAPRLKVAWYVNITKPSESEKILYLRKRASTEKTRIPMESNRQYQLKLGGTNSNYTLLATDGMVYALYPLTSASGMNGLWVIKDGGKSGQVSKFLDIDDGHLFAFDDNMDYHRDAYMYDEDIQNENLVNKMAKSKFKITKNRVSSHLSKHDGNLKFFAPREKFEPKIQSKFKTRRVWVQYYDFDIFSLDGNLNPDRTICMTDVLHCSDVKITSKMALMTPTNYDNQTLVLGLYIGSAKTDEFIALCYDFHVENCMQDYFVVAVDTETSEIKWLISTPDNVQVTGQIIGVPTSLRVGFKQDLLIMSAIDIETGERMIFSIGERTTL